MLPGGSGSAVGSVPGSGSGGLGFSKLVCLAWFGLFEAGTQFVAVVRVVRSRYSKHSIGGSSNKIGTMQKIAQPLRKDVTHKSGWVNM